MNRRSFLAGIGKLGLAAGVAKVIGPGHDAPVEAAEVVVPLPPPTYGIAVVSPMQVWPHDHTHVWDGVGAQPGEHSHSIPPFWPGSHNHGYGCAFQNMPNVCSQCKLVCTYKLPPAREDISNG